MPSAVQTQDTAVKGSDEPCPLGVDILVVNLGPTALTPCDNMYPWSL